MGDGSTAAHPIATSLSHALDMDELVPRDWIEQYAREVCSLVSVNAALAYFETWRTDSFPAVAMSILRKAGQCLHDLLREHGPWELLCDVARFRWPIFGWHHRVIVPDRRKLALGIEAPPMGLLLALDFESMYVRS